MSTYSRPIDISNMPEMLRIVEEVKATKQPRILKQDSVPVAMLMPVGTSIKHEKQRAKTKADYAAFHSAAGSWKDSVDVEQFKKDVYESRNIATRPVVRL